MQNERITLTIKEKRINDILVKLISGKIKTTEACRMTGLSERKKNINNRGLKVFLIKVEVNPMVEVILMN